jgi:hypothetical protein
MRGFKRLFFLILLFSSIVQAIPLSVDKVPTALKPWVDWVLVNESDYHCPFLNESYEEKRCAWPTELALILTAQKGFFSSRWQIYSDSWIVLPGSEKHWPIKVTANAKPIPVVKRYGKPMVKLPVGIYTLKGNLLWETIPESLTIPADSGLISLTINGKAIPYPTIKQNSVWLTESDRASKIPKNRLNKLEIQVFRQINDDVPLQLITYIELEVSGQQREIRLPHALLADFIPIRLQSLLPVKIEADNSLSVQVRPGRWHIELQARYPQALTTLALNIKDNNWPASEIWVFKAQPYQRVVTIQNLLPIDASQTNLPTAWKKLPAYQVLQGDVMGFNIIQRGDLEPEPNKLQLRRKLWLDFDGKGYTIQDKINGKMTQGWRLNALVDTQLGQVKLNGQNQLITQLATAKLQGVEVRKGILTLQADSRFTGDISHLNAVGWQHKFHHVSTELNLPPGWRLLATTGVDNAPDSWVSRWTLLDLFLVLMASLAISRLWHLSWGIFALLTLVLIWHEPNAPQWVWLNIIATLALIKVLPTGLLLSIVRMYRNACWLALLIITLPFLVDQVRKGLYPQLEKPWQQITTLNEPNPLAVKSIQSSADRLATAQQKVVAPELMKAPKTRDIRVQQEKSLLSEYTSQSKQSVNFNRIDPNAIVQTGLGAPQWQWHKIDLSWNGAVDSQQYLNLWLLTPTLTLILNFIGVAMVSLLSLLMLGLIKSWNFTFPSTPLILCLLAITLFNHQAVADSQPYPSQDLLDQLKARLIAPPDCVPDCAEIATMQLSINLKEINIQLVVHATHSVAIPLPATYKQWFPNQVKLNGKTATALLRDNTGGLWLNLTKGIHQVELSGQIPVHPKFTIPLPLKPHHVMLTADGWSIEGLHEHGIAENQLQFSRLATDLQSMAIPALEADVFPPFIRVERILELGLDWRLKTRIIRLINNDTAAILELPLLAGESVTTPEIRVKAGKVQVNMSANLSVLQWESILEKTPKIKLKATDTTQWTEVWQLDVSPIWHLTTEGITVIHHQDQQGHWLPEWRPWPGEQVSLSIIRPEAIDGRTLTIDSSKLSLKPGQRLQEARLELAIRSSKGVQHTITLPKKSKLQSVLINQISQPIRQKGSELTLPIKPGKQHIQINWQQNVGLTTIFSSPQLNLGLDSVNNQLDINLGNNRWVLFTTGPHFGPAVLFWGQLLVIVSIAFGLGKIEWTPLKHWQWFLLLVGLSQIPITAALVVVAWLIGLGIRAKKYKVNSPYFNAMQLGLGLLTIISLILLFVAVKQGLLGSPNMQIAGNQSSAYALKWYQDRSVATLPTATVISVPLMVYRILMLIWSLWLAISLLNWLKWGWACFSTEMLWKKSTLDTKFFSLSTKK